MKLDRFSYPFTSLALLLVQLALVSSIAAKYLYERRACPRVWTRATAFDPELAMRGRYLSLRLTVDGCQSTLPSAAQARFPRNPDGTASSGIYTVVSQVPVEFPAQLTVRNNRLVAIRIVDEEASSAGQMVWAQPGQSCQTMRLDAPVSFYLAEHAQSPLPLNTGQDLWTEVTLPPEGPPRPLQLALKQNGTWSPLAFQ